MSNADPVILTDPIETGKNTGEYKALIVTGGTAITGILGALGTLLATRFSDLEQPSQLMLLACCTAVLIACMVAGAYVVGMFIRERSRLKVAAINNGGDKSAAVAELAKRLAESESKRADAEQRSTKNYQAWHSVSQERDGLKSNLAYAEKLLRELQEKNDSSEG